MMESKTNDEDVTGDAHISAKCQERWGEQELLNVGYTEESQLVFFGASLVRIEAYVSLEKIKR